MATAKKKAAKKHVSSIKQAWLIWVGSEFYKDIEDWTTEAIAMGISKRLPNASMARALAEPGTVVFVAHDEGESTQCTACLGSIECPECRKRIGEMGNARKAIDKTLAAFKGAFPEEAPRSLVRFKEVRDREIAKLEAECTACKECGGKGKIKDQGTGGKVVLHDGRKWDYRTYVYWRNQPKKFHPETMVKELEMCEACGGRGDMPDAKIFGVFQPQRVEYIAKGDETADELKKMKGFTVVKKEALAIEHKRKCGTRKAGGVYVVTSADGDAGAALLDEAVKSGLLKPDGAEVHGNFVRFSRSIPVAEKRFRGLKRIDLKTVKDAADQAEMIADAMD
jgi:hypothetical protein